MLGKDQRSNKLISKTYIPKEETFHYERILLSDICGVIIQLRKIDAGYCYRELHFILMDDAVLCNMPKWLLCRQKLHFEQTLSSRNHSL